MNGIASFCLKSLKKVTTLQSRNKQEKLIISTVYKWFPILFTCVIIYLFPPIAFAIILAFFTFPLLKLVMNTTKLPLMISTLVTIACIISLFTAFIYILIHSLFFIIPNVEEHLSKIENSEDTFEKWFEWIEDQIVAFGQTLIEYVFKFSQSIFQQVMNTFIFLIAYFFALRESGKNRFWFLIYFPKKIRQQAKMSLMKASNLIVTFLTIELQLIFITFILLAVSFTILNFDVAIGIALLISLVDSVPFLGIGLFLIPMIIYFFVYDSPTIAISLIIIYALTIIIRQLIESALWSSAFQLRAIHAFFLLACSIYLFGFFGVLLTPFFLFLANKVKHHKLFNE